MILYNRLWHPALTEDAELILRDIGTSYKHKAKVFLAGYSAGTNIISRAMQVLDSKNLSCTLYCVILNYITHLTS